MYCQHDLLRATGRTASKPRRGSTSASRPRRSRSRRPRSSPASSRATCGRARTSTPRRRRGAATTRCSAWPRKASSPRPTAEEAKARPIKTAGLPTQHYSPAPYFVEEVRQQLEARFGAKQLYENGLSVQTSLDLPLQLAATRALQAGLRRLDQRRGFRAPTNLLKAGADLDAYRHPRWQGPMAVGDVVPAVVTGTTATEIQARAGRLDVRVPKAGFDWTGKTTAGALVSRGDLVQVLIERGGSVRSHRRRAARSGARVAGRRRRARQPDGTHPGDGRRLRLRSQQVQPRDPGVAATRVDVQAGGVHRGDRSRIHAGQHAARCAGGVSWCPRLTRLCPAELRPRVPGSHLAAARARAVAQRADGAADERARSEAGDRVRQEAGHHVADSALPLERPRRRRGHAARDHERLLVVPQPGRADDAVSDHPGDRSRGQCARGEPSRPVRGDPRRHGVRHDQPAARGRPARHGRACGSARLAARRQDRHDRRLHRCVVRRLRSRHHDRRVGRLRHQARRSARARAARWPRCRSGSTSCSTGSSASARAARVVPAWHSSSRQHRLRHQRGRGQRTGSRSSRAPEPGAADVGDVPPHGVSSVLVGVSPGRACPTTWPSGRS